MRVASLLALIAAPAGSALLMSRAGGHPIMQVSPRSAVEAAKQAYYDKQEQAIQTDGKSKARHSATNKQKPCL